MHTGSMVIAICREESGTRTSLSPSAQSSPLTIILFTSRINLLVYNLRHIILVSDCGITEYTQQ
jgi:hypothetical protein